MESSKLPLFFKNFPKICFSRPKAILNHLNLKRKQFTNVSVSFNKLLPGRCIMEEKATGYMGVFYKQIIFPMGKALFE